MQKLDIIVAKCHNLCYYKVYSRSIYGTHNHKSYQFLFSREEFVLPHCKNTPNPQNTAKHSKNHIKQTFYFILLKNRIHFCITPSVKPYKPS
jgi:hypothetical protein